MIFMQRFLLKFINNILCLKMMFINKKQYKHRPEGFRRWSSQISRESEHEGDNVVRPTHRPPLPPGNIPGTHFC